MNYKDILFERELLFSTNSEHEIGVIDVKLVSLKQSDKIIAIVRSKSGHDIFNYTENILKILNSEMFARIKVNILKNVDIIFVNDLETKRIVFESEESIQSFKFEQLEQAELELFK